MVLSIHGFSSGWTIFPYSHRVQDPIPTPTWCIHRSNYQIVSILFSICYINLFIIEKFYVLSLERIISFYFRIFVHAKNNFNHIKEGFLDYQRRNNSSVSPNQAIRYTCHFTGFNQSFCPQLNTCPYLQERATKCFIL